VNVARGLLGSGRWPEAEHLLNNVLAASPEQPGALHLMGALRAAQDRAAEALPLLQRAIELEPEEPGRWNDLGNALAKLGRLDETMSAYTRSAQLAGDSPAGADAHNNLGRMHSKGGRPADAVEHFRRAAELRPDFAHAWYNLAQSLYALNQIEAGTTACARAITIAPQHAARESVARALVHLGRTEDAVTYYRQWLSEDAENPVVQHHLAALLEGQETPARASDAYVEVLFDRFADSFDAQLARLEYHAPALVCDALKAELSVPGARLAIADAGCGTGLCGPLVRPWASHLCGFDLSGGMLARAEQRGVYDELRKAELVEFLESRPADFDLVISADTLCYFGDIDRALASFAQALRKPGRAIFTVEASDESDTASYRLLSSGRYSHRREYVTSAATRVGFSVVTMTHVALRTEAGKPVMGWLVTLART
jgi:predicted TPR repeat methyltransferase